MQLSFALFVLAGPQFCSCKKKHECILYEVKDTVEVHEVPYTEIVKSATIRLWCVKSMFDLTGECIAWLVLLLLAPVLSLPWTDQDKQASSC